MSSGSRRRTAEVCLAWLRAIGQRDATRQVPDGHTRQAVLTRMIPSKQSMKARKLSTREIKPRAKIRQACCSHSDLEKSPPHAKQVPTYTHRHCISARGVEAMQGGRPHGRAYPFR